MSFYLLDKTHSAILLDFVAEKLAVVYCAYKTWFSLRSVQFCASHGSKLWI